MRAKLLSICAVLLVLCVAAPATAAKPSRYNTKEASANAFWYETQQVSKNTTRSVVTYVGVYESSDGDSAYADVYRDVETCKVTKRSEECDYTSELYGEAYLSGDEFSIADDLSSAHLDADFELYSDSGDSTGTVHVVTDWTGIGEVDSSRETYNFHSDCFSYRQTYNSSNRSAEAEGSLDDADLGETYDAWIGISSSRSTERTC